MVHPRLAYRLICALGLVFTISCTTTNHVKVEPPPLAVEASERVSDEDFALDKDDDPDELAPRDTKEEPTENSVSEPSERSKGGLGDTLVLERAEHPDTESNLVDIPIVVRPKTKSGPESESGSEVLDRIPENSPIVITNIEGPCATTVTDALMRRLVNNSNLNVVTRRYLGQIIGETDINWGGRFDTETTAQLGKFKGASHFIVGKVIYCNKTRRKAKGTEETEEWQGQFDILAVLQLLDTETGEVILSSAPKGVYAPNFSPRVANRNPWNVLREIVNDDPASVTVNFPELEAADDLANDFANTLFGRPSWESLLMWRNNRWHFDEVVNYVKLGRCQEAVNTLESLADLHFKDMEAFYVAEYLHNYGVAYLCNNESKKAMRKLRASYRLAYREDTLRMLDLAGRVEEWKLNIEVEKEPEIQRLMERQRFLGRLDP